MFENSHPVLFDTKIHLDSKIRWNVFRFLLVNCFYLKCIAVPLPPTNKRSIVEDFTFSSVPSHWNWLRTNFNIRRCVAGVVGSQMQQHHWLAIEKVAFLMPSFLRGGIKFFEHMFYAKLHMRSCSKSEHCNRKNA